MPSIEAVRRGIVDDPRGRVSATGNPALVHTAHGRHASSREVACYAEQALTSVLLLSNVICLD
ncbi:hypothetical protein ACU4GD_19480 [Cupriavidus basilensis]